MKEMIKKKQIGAYGYVIPALLVFSVFLLYPFFNTI